MTALNLERCPFCESEARILQTRDSALWFYVECGHCFTRQLASESKAEAVHRWNIRGADWTWRPSDAAS